MKPSTTADQLYSQLKANKWLRYFTVFNRVALAWGFLPSGFVKIMGERFTALSNNHPMGNYLEALHHTGYYYTFIGIAQVTAALLLLIPRTALLGVLLYFPIILNICILSLAVRFEGSLITSPLMVLSCMYLLCWDYDRLKLVLPFRSPKVLNTQAQLNANNQKFPFQFFAGVAGAVIMVLVLTHTYQIMPRNTFKDCKQQCKSKNKDACYVFCDCIHNQGMPLNKSLDVYNKALKAQP